MNTNGDEGWKMSASRSSEAEYMKIRRYVLNMVTKAGEESIQLPTALELSKQFGVCRQTVGKALKQLAEDRFVIGKPGLGTFTLLLQFVKNWSQMMILRLSFGRLKILRRIYSRSLYPYACRSIVLTLLLKPSIEALVMFPNRQNPKIPSQYCNMVFAILCS